MFRRFFVALLLAAAARAQSLPVISTTSHSFLVEGGPDTTLVIDGSGFTPGSVARLDGARLTTTFLSAALLTAVVPATITTRESHPLLTVANADGAVSPPFQMFVVPYFPAVTRLTPDVVPAGGPAFTLTIDGQNFLPDTTLNWDNAAFLTAATVTPTRITVAIPAALTRAPAVVPIWVETWDANRDGAGSNQATIRVGLPLPSTTPVIDSFSPVSGIALGPEFILTVNGRNFDRNAVVRWNGGGVQTTYVNSTQLLAMIPTAQQNPCCVMDFSVINPTAESDNARFTLRPAPAAVLLLSPAGAAAVGGPLALTVRGYGFRSDAVIYWNNTPLSTTFGDASRLTATVPTGLFFPPAAAHVNVITGGYTTGWLPFSLTGPIVAPGGVVNGASSLPGIAPGSLISIYGTDFANGVYTASGAPLPASLGGASVTINGIVAPLLFVSPTQINAQAPYETGLGTTSLIVKAGNFFSPAALFPLGATAPGIYQLPLTDHAIAVNLPEGTLNSSKAPAAPGQFVTLYLTGQGAVSPRVDTGSAAPGDVLAFPLAASVATLAGVPAKVLFSGLAPGFVGVLQVNLQIPNVLPGEQTLQVTIGGVPGNPTRLSVRAP